MKYIFLVNYSVKGIKTLEELVSLSFYKKTISKDPDTQAYNVKGIYGMNGSGKSGIITSVNVLKNILVNPEYLNSLTEQKNLNEIINKKLQELTIEADFIARFPETILYFRYQMKLSKNQMEKYVISREAFYVRKSNARDDSMESVFTIENGEIQYLSDENSQFSKMMQQRTTNLLGSASFCALFFEKFLLAGAGRDESNRNHVFRMLEALFTFGRKLHVFLDQADDHKDFFVRNTLRYMDAKESNESRMDLLMSRVAEANTEQLGIIRVSYNIVGIDNYADFETAVSNLYDFIHIFKFDLKGIEIDKREDRGFYLCNLVMIYDSYKIHAEFESTGIKKLIRLYAYFREIVRGGIVFIDELDSNLHDVYLCALLEYLMEYAEGQLCFTTHNVGPMDILRRNKKSIDFLSTDGKVYPWTTNGNYSPSNLYRKGMIEGSPFNVDSIDFIGIFGSGEDE